MIGQRRQDHIDWQKSMKASFRVVIRKKQRRELKANRDKYGILYNRESHLLVHDFDILIQDFHRVPT